MKDQVVKNTYLGSVIGENEDNTPDLYKSQLASPIYKGDYSLSIEEKELLIKSGQALEDGTFPITNQQDLYDAVALLDFVKGERRKSVEDFIVKRANELGIQKSDKKAENDQQYKMLVKKKLKEYGVNEIKELSEEQKKKFFSELDSAHTSEKEKAHNDEDMEDEDMQNGDMEDEEETKEKAEGEDPCWDGYEQYGMKEGDNGQPVPNCVKKGEVADKVLNKGIVPDEFTDLDGSQKLVKVQLEKGDIFNLNDVEVIFKGDHYEVTEKGEAVLKNDINKGKPLPEGTIRTHGGKRVQKKKGKWKPVSQKKNDEEESSSEKGIDEKVQEYKEYHEEKVEDFKELVNDKAEQYGGESVIAPAKKFDRIKEKALEDYDGDVTQVKDVLRSTIVVGNREQARDMYDQLTNGKNNKVLKSWCDFQKSGYRGANIVLEMEGRKAEIQINTPINLALKDNELPNPAVEKTREILKDAGIEPGQGHAYYEKVRVEEEGVQEDTSNRYSVTEEMNQYYNEGRRTYQENLGYQL